MSVLIMMRRRGFLASVLIIVLIVPLASSSILPTKKTDGGLDADGEWQSSMESGIHNEWWLDWSRDRITEL